MLQYEGTDLRLSIWKKTLKQMKF